MSMLNDFAIGALITAIIIFIIYYYTSKPDEDDEEYEEDDNVLETKLETPDRMDLIKKLSRRIVNMSAFERAATSNPNENLDWLIMSYLYSIFKHYNVDVFVGEFLNTHKDVEDEFMCILRERVKNPNQPLTEKEVCEIIQKFDNAVALVESYIKDMEVVQYIKEPKTFDDIFDDYYGK